MGEILLHHRAQQYFRGVEQEGIGQPFGQRRARHGGEGIETLQRFAAFHQGAGAGLGQFQGEAAQMFRQPGAPMHHQAIAGLQQARGSWSRAPARHGGHARASAHPGWCRSRHAGGRTEQWPHQSIPFISSSGKFQPHLLIMLAVLRPVLAHLDEQEQMHAAAEQFFHLLARQFADDLDGGAALAQRQSPSGRRAAT